MAFMMIGSVLRILTGASATLNFFETIGKKGLLIRLKDITKSVECFKQALAEDDSSSLVQTFKEYELQLDMLNKRLLGGISKHTDQRLRETLLKNGLEPEAGFLEKNVIRKRRARSKKAGIEFLETKAELSFQLDVVLGTLRGVSKGLRANASDRGGISSDGVKAKKKRKNGKIKSAETARANEISG